jgi:flagellar FliJ protein
VKRFTFGLEKVLKLRQYHEQEAKNELGRVISILNAIENKIEQNAVMRQEAAPHRFAGISVEDGGPVSDHDHDPASGLVGDRVGGLAGASEGYIDMLAWDSYINRLEQEAQHLAEEAAQAEIVVEEKRNLYLEASRELKVMEKLKEKRETEYRKEMFAAATREMDDLWRDKRV